MSGFASYLSNLDDEYGLGKGTLEEQEQIESGGNPNEVSSTGAEGLFQILPSTAANPGYGVSPISDPTDPYQSATFAAQYDSALAQQTGGVGSGLAAYNEGLGGYQANGIAGASPAYQSMIASLGMGTSGQPISQASDGTNSESEEGGGQGSTAGSEAGSAAGSAASGLAAQAGIATSNGGEDYSTYISGWIIRILIAVGGLICIGVALTMFKQTAPIVTAITTPVKRAAKGAAKAAAV